MRRSDGSLRLNFRPVKMDEGLTSSDLHSESITKSAWHSVAS